MSLEAKNLIGYQAVAGKGAGIQAVDPATDERLAPVYHEVSDADFDRALDLAQTAFLQYRELSDAARAQFLDSIAAEIEADSEAIIQRAMQETALPHARLQGECARTCNQLRLFAAVVRQGAYRDIRRDEAMPQRQPPRPDIRYRKIGLGPVAVFGASNFPLAFSVAGGDTASALAAGCPVVVKAHNAHPGTSEYVGRAVQRAAQRCGMPEGVFALLYGEGNRIGEKLVGHPHIKAVGFTGSRAGGLALLKLAQARPEPIPVYAEMSSINPVYLMPDALATQAEALGRALVAAMTMGAGQFCTSPGVVFAAAGAGFDAFTAAARAALAVQTAQTMLTPAIARAFEQGIQNLAAHAQLLAAGEASGGIHSCRARLFVVEGDVFAGNEALRQEVFGSAAVIVCCRDFAQMQMLTEQLEGQLTAAVHATADDDVGQLKSLLSQLERKAGRIVFNGFGTGVEVCGAMVHGGPFPATSDSRSTSVGATAIDRFLRPVCYQDVPADILPEAF
ncbi:aldehyde dehydrogenase (NADP(+)) [Uruburuella testudinis]|uniref:Aldehyde dehydrogenase (NADP(+)) n=1 Tax=Uruburuella testudinis TaxID=1282863 RepID=A0ABY4DXZ3_9NEIS|nr:aldehyde dehydrogenase (NADP(+)) [Uruburuella testudinis]UOO82482.1 aldehyde dehydrogenase (NADP(+)) [Uruburuella testudinis]